MSAARNIRRAQWKSNHRKHGKQRYSWKTWHLELRREINQAIAKAERDGSQPARRK